MNPPYNPNSIAQAGQEIYKRKFQEQYEKEHRGKYVAINIRKETATLGDSAQQALDAALEADPAGLFHLVRVGYVSAFQAGFASSASENWLFRQ
jgi:hypothetical protein